MDHLRARMPRHHATRIADSGQGPVAMWAGDGGYDANDATLGGPRHRLEMFGDRYRYVDTLEDGLGDESARDSERSRP